jgi:hypothetical protein
MRRSRPAWLTFIDPKKFASISFDIIEDNTHGSFTPIRHGKLRGNFFTAMPASRRISCRGEGEAIRVTASVPTPQRHAASGSSCPGTSEFL